MNFTSKYRTHHCSELGLKDIDSRVTLSGWLHRKRDHGTLLFVDLRDNYGLTQIVFNENSKDLEKATCISLESVIRITGTVVKRSDDTINENLATGKIEVLAESLEVESICAPLPMQINSPHDAGEDIRLKYRYLDLRRERMHNNILKRADLIAFTRSQMQEMGFKEFQTPILTSSSPEGARDYLVPSRLHPGKCYALPQAPQIFKQLAMIAGFDKYFQIAPCFRDEDARADRSPGEFYQLDLEMSFVEQEQIFEVTENIISKIFEKFSPTGKQISKAPFRKITYKDAMLTYGSDKPDLRNPIKIQDVTDIFRDSDFAIFTKQISSGAVVRAITCEKAASQPRSFFDKLHNFAVENGASGLGYITFSDGTAKGPVAKFLHQNQLQDLKQRAGLNENGTIFFCCGIENDTARLSGLIRTRLGETLDLIDKNKFEFCWILDFPYFELKDGKIDFSHNPFSMPQGGLEVLKKAQSKKDYLDIIAYQYDLVCNGVELSSGAIRNHKVEILQKAFEIVGYSPEEIEEKFGAFFDALKYGVPPHGGCAPGIDRILMMLCEEETIREVIMFPMNQKCQDLMMRAPCAVSEKHLRELHMRFK